VKKDAEQEMVDTRSPQALDELAERLAVVRLALTNGYAVDEQIGRELVNLLLVLAHYPYEQETHRPSPPLASSVKPRTSLASALWSRVLAMSRPTGRKR